MGCSLPYTESFQQHLYCKNLSPHQGFGLYDGNKLVIAPEICNLTAMGCAKALGDLRHMY